MLRNLGISLLLFGLLAAGIDGFRVRERAERDANGSLTTSETAEEGQVLSAENGGGAWPR